MPTLTPTANNYILHDDMQMKKEKKSFDAKGLMNMQRFLEYTLDLD